MTIKAASWLSSVTGGNELGPVYPVQVNQSKYEDHENEGAMGQCCFKKKSINVFIL